MAVSSDTKLIDISGLKTAITLILNTVSSNTAKNINAIESTASDTIIFKCTDGSTAFTLVQNTPATYTHPTFTAATGTPTVDASPSFGGTFNVNQVSRDTEGHVSAITSRTITIPSAVATTLASGLMSKDDKIKLNGIATGANAYSHPTYTARTGSPSSNQTPAFGGTFTVSQITSDSLGHVTGANDKTITIPSLPTASSSTSGCIKVGTGLSMNNDTLSLDSSSLILPSIASANDRAMWIS